MSSKIPFYYCQKKNLQQLVANSEVGIIFKIPWGHHIQILTKCKGNRDKALYFVRQSLNNNWSRAVLMNFLDTNLYERDGTAITNFEKMLPGVGTVYRYAILQYTEALLCCNRN